MNFDNEEARRLLLKFASVCYEHKYITKEEREKLIDDLLNNRAVKRGFEDCYMAAIQGVSVVAEERGRNEIISRDVRDWFTSKTHNMIAVMNKIEECKGYKGKVLSAKEDGVVVQTTDGDKPCKPLYVHPKIGDVVAIHHNKVIYRFEDE